MSVATAPRPTQAATNDTVRIAPVVWWAGLGALTVAFIVFVLARWVTGPYFETVPSGPSVPPIWMRSALIFWQVFAVVGTVGLLWWKLVRPWRRDGEVRTDGLLVIAFFLTAFQDPLSGLFGNWFTWNAYLVNKGSWIYSIPGTSAYGQPGAAVVEPLYAGFIWVWIAFAGAWVGAWVLRRATRRFPRLGPAPLIVFVLFPAMMVFDIILEGLVAIPSGLYVYSGGHFSLFPDSYTKFPLHEAVFAGATLAGLAALRFFKNDRGETFAERGIHDVRIGRGRQTALRLLALIFFCQLIPFVTYNLPSGWVAGAHSGTWPQSIQRLSYFTAHMCGAEAKSLCPRDGVPLIGNAALQIGADGSVVVDDDVAAGMLGARRIEAPGGDVSPVPFSDGDASPFSGRLFGASR